MSWNSTLDGYLFQIEENVKRQKEKAEDVINLVKECFAEADFDIPDAVLDRAHRIGPVYKMSQIRTFKELLFSLITSDTDQCFTKIGKDYNEENAFEST